MKLNFLDTFTKAFLENSIPHCLKLFKLVIQTTQVFPYTSFVVYVEKFLFCSNKGITLPTQFF